MKNVSIVLADVGEVVMISTIVLTIFLTSVIMHMWTLVNALQIMGGFYYINMPMPALVLQL